MFSRDAPPTALSTDFDFGRRRASTSATHVFGDDERGRRLGRTTAALRTRRRRLLLVLSVCAGAAAACTLLHAGLIAHTSAARTDHGGSATTIRRVLHVTSVLPSDATMADAT